MLREWEWGTTSWHHSRSGFRSTLHKIWTRMGKNGSVSWDQTSIAVLQDRTHICTPSFKRLQTSPLRITNLPCSSVSPLLNLAVPPILSYGDSDILVSYIYVPQENPAVVCHSRIDARIFSSQVNVHVHQILVKHTLPFFAIVAFNVNPFDIYQYLLLRRLDLILLI